MKQGLLAFILNCLMLPCIMAQTQQECYNRSSHDWFTDEEVEAIFSYVCGEVVHIHSDAMQAGGESHGALFLQWHREYIGGLEDYLLAEGFDHLVPFPAWNPCNTIPQGSLSVCEGLNPENTDLEGETLADCNDFDDGLFDCESLCDYEDFETFQSFLQLKHNGIHGAEEFTGTFAAMATSPGVVLFWAWHAYVDDIYLKYQAATLDPALPLNVERVKDPTNDCCEFTYRIRKLCCLTGVDWTINGVPIDDGSTWVEGGYYYMRGTATGPTVTVLGVISSTCGNTLTRGISHYNDSPEFFIHQTVPLHIQDICFDDMREENCYNFGFQPCLETLEFETSSDKLIVQVEGSQICLYTLSPQSSTETLTITPTCGTTEPVTWTINLNGKDCKGFDPGFGLITVNVFPNPFSDELNIRGESSDAENSYTVSVMNAFGKEVLQSKSLNNTFSTKALGSGLYLVVVKNEKQEIIFSDHYLKY